MKKIFATMLVVFLAVGSAYAMDLTYTGEYFVRGNYEDNLSSVNDDSDRGSHMYYDHEFVLEPTFTVSDATNIRAKLKFNDVTWDEANRGSEDPKEASQNIMIDRLFGTHTFGTGTQFQGGLMTAGEWAYKFGDSSTGAYRARINQPLGDSTLIFILQKDKEGTVSGGFPVEGENTESKDKDEYLLGWVGKVGNIDILPLIGYITDGSTNTDAGSSDTNTTMVIDLGAGGEHGMIGWEAEIKYLSLNFDGTDAATGGNTDGFSVYGAYAGAWFNLGAVTPGIKLAYGSYDEEDGSFAYGGEYDSGGMMIMGENVGFGPGNTDPTDETVAGATTITVYADFAANESLSFFAGLAYLMSNSSDDGPWKDASAYELDVKGTYKITDNVSYNIDMGYASVDWDEDGMGAEDPDGITKIQHKLTITF